MSNYGPAGSTRILEELNPIYPRVSEQQQIHATLANGTAMLGVILSL